VNIRKAKVATHFPEFYSVEGGMKVMRVLKLLGKKVLTLLGRLVEKSMGYLDDETRWRT
jgi:hypothetical protein